MTEIALNDFPKLRPSFAPQRCKVVDRKNETADIVTLTIDMPDHYGNWATGQFNMLYLFGLGEIPVSISGDPSDVTHLTHTIRAVGPVSLAVCKLQVGDCLWLRGPYGKTWPEVSPERDLLIVAGGIGLAPLRPVILKELRQKRRGRVILLYGTRTPSDVLFSDDLVNWALAHADIHVTVDRLEQNKKWSGSVGVVTHLLPHLNLDPRNTIAMTCGPEVMMRHLCADLTSMGLSDSQIFVSMERNMKCAVGLCGRCQWGPYFVCRDGPVYSLSQVRQIWNVKDF